MWFSVHMAWHFSTYLFTRFPIKPSWTQVDGATKGDHPWLLSTQDWLAHLKFNDVTSASDDPPDPRKPLTVCNVYFDKHKQYSWNTVYTTLASNNHCYIGMNVKGQICSGWGLVAWVYILPQNSFFSRCATLFPHKEQETLSWSPYFGAFWS